jgi:hypothetical protein
VTLEASILVVAETERQVDFPTQAADADEQRASTLLI